MRMKINRRLLWPDLIKTIAIYFVIVVHASPESMVFSVIKVCVPLFVMVSGALLIPKTESDGDFFRKRLTTVLIPWIGGICFYLIWNYFFHNRTGRTPAEWFYLIEMTSVSQFWFIPMIGTLYLFTPVIRKLAQSAKRQDKIYISILWLCLVSIIPFYRPTLAFPRPSEAGLLALAVYYSGYFLIGYFLSTLKSSSKGLLIACGLTGFGFLMTLANLAYLDNIRNLNISFAYDYFAPNIAITSIGIFFMLKNAADLYVRKINQTIKYVLSLISQSCLYIYMFHNAVRDMLVWLNHDGWLYQVIMANSYTYSLIILLIFLLLALLVQKATLMTRGKI